MKKSKGDKQAIAYCVRCTKCGINGPSIISNELLAINLWNKFARKYLKEMYK